VTLSEWQSLNQAQVEAVDAGIRAASDRVGQIIAMLHGSAFDADIEDHLLELHRELWRVRWELGILPEAANDG